MRHAATRLLPLLAALVLATPVTAQTPRGLKTHLRLVNSMSGQTTPGEWRGGDGWTTAGPLVTTAVNHVTDGGGMYSNSDFVSVADYGYLHFQGSGSAQSIPGNGLFLWVDDWIGAEPRAQYRDRLYVTSASLPAGTPAVVRFTLDLSGSTTIVDATPSSSFTATFTATHGGPPFDYQLTLANGPGSTAADFPTFVGDSIDVNGRLAVYLYAYGLMQAGPHSGSIAADVTARIGAASQTPGVTVSSNSGTVGVPAATAATFALQGAQPNPARSGRVSVRFALPSGEPATLALFDLGGRRIDEVAVGTFGAGSHTVELSRGRPLAPGIYLARLTRGIEARTARVVVVD